MKDMEFHAKAKADDIKGVQHLYQFIIDNLSEEENRYVLGDGDSCEGGKILLSVQHLKRIGRDLMASVRSESVIVKGHKHQDLERPTEARSKSFPQETYDSPTYDHEDCGDCTLSSQSNDAMESVSDHEYEGNGDMDELERTEHGILSGLKGVKAKKRAQLFPSSVGGTKKVGFLEFGYTELTKEIQDGAESETDNEVAAVRSPIIGINTSTRDFSSTNPIHEKIPLNMPPYHMDVQGSIESSFHHTLRETRWTTQANSYATPTIQTTDILGEKLSPVQNGGIGVVYANPRGSQQSLSVPDSERESQKGATTMGTTFARSGGNHDTKGLKRKRSTGNIREAEYHHEPPNIPIEVEISREIDTNAQAITLDEALEVLTKTSSREPSLVSTVIQNEIWGKYKDQIGTLLQKTSRLMTIPRRTLEEVVDIDTRVLLSLHSKDLPSANLETIQWRLQQIHKKVLDMAMVRDQSEMTFNVLESFIWQPVVRMVVIQLELIGSEETGHEDNSYLNWSKYVPKGANLGVDEMKSFRLELIKAVAPIASRASIKPEKYIKCLHRLHLMREKGFLYLIAVRNATLTKVLLEETRMDEDDSVLAICEIINDFLHTQMQGSLLVPIYQLSDRSNHPEPVVFDMVSAAQFFSSKNNLLKTHCVGERMTPVGTRMFGFLGDRNRNKSGSLKMIKINGLEKLVCMVPMRPGDFLGWIGGTVCTKERLALLDCDVTGHYRRTPFWRGLYLLSEMGGPGRRSIPNINRLNFTSDKGATQSANCVFTWRIDSHTALSRLPGRYSFLFPVLAIAACPGFTPLLAVSSF